MEKTNGRLAVLCPTRGKPEIFAAFAESVRKHSSRADLFWYLALDDPKRDEYMKLDIPGMTTGAPLGYARGMNRLWNEHPGYEGYFTGEDDYEIIEPQWDAHMLTALPPDGCGLVYCWHKWEATQMMNHHTTMLGHALARALGYIAPPALQHHYLIEAWREIGLALPADRHSVIVQNLLRHHYKSAPDIVSIGVDYVPYRDWFENQFKKDMKAVIAWIQREEPWE